MPSSSVPVEVLAFLRRCYWRQTRWGVNVDKRAAAYIELLDHETDSLRGKIALCNLRREYDLLSDEFLSLNSVLSLQLKILERAEVNAEFDDLVRQMLVEPPLCKLLNALLVQMALDKQTRLTINLGTEDRDFFGSSYGDGTEVMSIPNTIRLALRETAYRAEKIGYSRYRQHVGLTEKTPESGRFLWTDDRDFVIELGT